MPLERSTLEAALKAAGERAGQPLELNSAGSVGLAVGPERTEVVIDWVEKGGCAAVHAALSLPEGVDLHQAARVLMQAHLAGAATRGCTFWLVPDGSVRVGALLLGPTCGEEEVLEAVGRVVEVAGQAPLVEGKS